MSEAVGLLPRGLAADASSCRWQRHQPLGADVLAAVFALAVDTLRAALVGVRRLLAVAIANLLDLRRRRLVAQLLSGVGVPKPPAHNPSD